MNAASSIVPCRRTPTMVIFYTVAVVLFFCVSGGCPVVAIQRSFTIDEHSNNFETREMKKESKGGKGSKGSYNYNYYGDDDDDNVKGGKVDKKDYKKDKNSKGSSKDSKSNRKDKSYSKRKRESKPSRSEDKPKGKKEGENIVVEDTQVLKDVVEGNAGEIDEGRTDVNVDVEENEINRTVRLLHLDASNECMTYNSTLDQMAVYMVNCSTVSKESGDEIAWEILETTTEDTFYLRQKLSQQCIPKNPESPRNPFDCDRYSRTDQAIADSINGLVDCTSEFAAAFGMNTTTKSMHLTNNDCSDDLNIIFMSYSRRESPKEIQTVVWGEKILLDLSDVVEEHNFQYKWIFEDIVN